MSGESLSCQNQCIIHDQMTAKTEKFIKYIYKGDIAFLPVQHLCVGRPSVLEIEVCEQEDV